MIAYLLIPAASGALGLLINLIVYVIVVVIILYILRLLGVPENIVRVISLLIALLLIVSLFAGCAGSGTGGQWTARDTSDALGAVNTGITTYDRISHPEYYRPVYPAPVIVP